MRIEPAMFEGVSVISLVEHRDSRGSFSRLFCQKELKEIGFASEIAQVNLSRSLQAGTLRGLRYQVPPHQEDKVVSCISGKLFDVFIDLRPKSSTFCKASSCFLSAGQAIFLPKGFAHGFLTLEDDTDLIYFVSGFYTPDSERTIRWNDPFFSVEWPSSPSSISERDANCPDFSLETYTLDFDEGSNS